MMKAAVVTAAGQGPSFSDFAEPVAGEGEEIITVLASALSQVTRSRASGAHYSSDGQFPLIPGVDGVGRRADGTRVFFFMPRAPYGTLSERTVVRAGMSIPLPDDLNDATAAAIANPGVSSWAALTERAGLKPGQTVLVNGATGTSGQLAVQVAKHLGAARVVATGRNPDKLELLRRFGADAVIPLVEDDDALEVSLKAQFAQGVDVVLDYLWGRSARTALIAAARAGNEDRPMRFVSIGSVAGPEIALPSAVLRSSRIELIGSGLGSIPIERLTSSISALLTAAGSGRLTVATRAVPLAEIGAAWTAPDDGRRIVILPGAQGV
jgi:NADPH:quinone reductase-like Zn-dependent oxidoreductase